MSDRAGANPVVVTGVGCVTPVGIGSADSWNRVVAGAGGVVAIDRFDTSGFPVRIAAQVPGFSGDRWFPPKEVRRTDRYIQLAAAATDEAVHQSGLKITTANRDRVGVVIGSAMGGMETLESGFATLATRGPNRVSPFFVPMMLADMASGIVSIRLGARGPNLATVSACASG
ncbi:MAG TPA: beta-ketoacyl synthase N-terminal-like domain-containing protein, partial [Thermomicrobiales bacterium]|nr:beta-ketoacyl synthase N-terminal-like domain-containing protein [Thermomicrobiales bacterium]